MVAPTDPMWYRRGGAYEVNTDVEDIYLKWDNMIPTEQLPAFQEMAAFLVEEQPRTERELADAMIRMRRRIRIIASASSRSVRGCSSTRNAAISWNAGSCSVGIMLSHLR